MNLPPFEIGDRIRTDTGQTGKIVVITFGGSAAYVQFDGTDHGSTLAIYPAEQLARLDDDGSDQFQKA